MMSTAIPRFAFLALSAIAVTIPSASVFGGDSDSRLTRFVSEERGFSVDMPPSPKVQASKTAGSGWEKGKVFETLSVESTDQDQGVLYRVIAVERPAPANRSDRYVNVRDTANALIKHLFKETPTPSKVITQAGLAGREFSNRLQFEDTELAVHVRVFYENEHIYQLFAIGECDAVESAQSKQFMDSFRTLSPTKSTPNDFVTFTSPSNNFRVALPANPKWAIGQPQPGQPKTRMVHAGIAQNGIVEASYFVLQEDDGELLADQDGGLREHARKLIEKLLPANSLTKTVEFTPIDHAGTQGLEFQYDNSGDEKSGGRIRVYSSNGKVLYQMVHGPESILKSNRTDHFFDSFELLAMNH
ncbi:MAG: hypothetical protein AAGJ40_03315 [Planctomycetota bacterium]